MTDETREDAVAVAASHSEAEIAEMAALLGGEVSEVYLDHDEQAVFEAAHEVRTLLHQQADQDNVTAAQLARRLAVSPSAVSRMLKNDGDIKLSTAVLWARALGQRWGFKLSPIEHSSNDGSNTISIRVVTENHNKNLTSDYNTQIVIMPKKAKTIETRRVESVFSS